MMLFILVLFFLQLATCYGYFLPPFPYCLPPMPLAGYSRYSMEDWVGMKGKAFTSPTLDPFFSGREERYFIFCVRLTLSVVFY